MRPYALSFNGPRSREPDDGLGMEASQLMSATLVSPLVSGRSPRADWSALTGVTTIVAMLPAWLVTTSLIWLPFGWFGDVDYRLFVGAFFSLFIVLFSRPVQRFVLLRLLGAREPTRHERESLDAAWRPIMRRNMLEQRRFVFAVVDTDALNAFACGGHLVLVSSHAVERLTTEKLSGVIAHELSHHLGLHTVSLTIAQWMILPVVLLSRVGMRLRAIAEDATHAFARRLPLLHALGLFVAAFLHVVSWLLMLNVSLANMLGNAASRATEFHADRRAARLGFGHALLAAMREWESLAPREARGNVWQRVFASHPPMRLRINKLASHLRTSGMSR
jgi:Zn-dependent protease with chaperone function